MNRGQPWLGRKHTREIGRLNGPPAELIVLIVCAVIVALWLMAE